MESRTANLVLRLLQRHLPVHWSAGLIKQAPPLPCLFPRVPLPFHAPAAVGASGQRSLDSFLASGIERNQFGFFFKQPSPSSPSLDRAIDISKLAVPPKLDVELSEPAWGFKLGLRLKSGLYMPPQLEEVEWEASSVKRKRKKKMNKHKQRKLRRRDRHRN